MSLLAIFRGLLGRRARALVVTAFLFAAALSGAPIRPEEIEEHMRAMSKAEIVQMLEREQQPSGEPPETDGAAI